MSDESAHALTLRLLEEVAGLIASERQEDLVVHRQRVERLLDVKDDDSALATARELLRDALSV